MAFRDSGRSKVIVAIGPEISTKTLLAIVSSGVGTLNVELFVVVPEP